MEIADVFVINKADRDGAERMEREIRALQGLAMRRDNWTPPIVKTVASEGIGMDDLAVAIASYEEFLAKENLLLSKKVENWRGRLVEMLRDELLERVLRDHVANGEVAQMATEIAQHKRDPYDLVEQLIDHVAK
jgi:LAO/AO transport system kinase